MGGLRAVLLVRGRGDSNRKQAWDAWMRRGYAEDGRPKRKRPSVKVDGIGHVAGNGALDGEICTEGLCPEL